MPPTRETVLVKYLSTTSWLDAHAPQRSGCLVGLDGGDAHLGGNLHDAAAARPGCNLRRRRSSPCPAARSLIRLPMALLGQIGVDGPRRRSPAGWRSGVRPAARRSPGSAPWRCACVVRTRYLLTAPHRQQGGDGHMVLVHAPVGEDQDVGPVLGRPGPQSTNRRSRARFPEG